MAVEPLVVAHGAKETMMEYAKPFAALGMLAAGAAVVLAGTAPCYIPGPVVDCAQCTSDTGNTCNGSPCNTTVNMEIDIKTLRDAPLGVEGRPVADSQPAGACWRTARTCVNGVCVESVTTGEQCVDTVPSGQVGCEGKAAQ